MIKVTIRIPTPLRAFTGGAGEVVVQGGTVAEALGALGQAHEGILERVLDEHGSIRGFVNVYLDDTDVRSLGGLDAPVSDSTVISIVPAVAGGLR